jgi:hypothetical protein
MGDSAVDLCATDRWRAYIRKFRDSHPLDRELAAKYGVLTEIGDSDADSMTQSTRGTFGGRTA